MTAEMFTFQATRGQPQFYGARTLKALALGTVAIDNDDPAVANVSDIEADEVAGDARPTLTGVSWDVDALQLLADDPVVTGLTGTVGAIVWYDNSGGALVGGVRFDPVVMTGGDIPVVLPGGALIGEDTGDAILGIIAGDGVVIDNSDARYPVVSATGGGGADLPISSDDVDVPDAGDLTTVLTSVFATANAARDAIAADAWLQPVRAVATSTVNLAVGGLLTVDGVTVAAGDLVLLTGQTSPIENCVAVAAVGTWTLTAVANAAYVSGSTVRVTEGTTHGGSEWYISTPNPIVLGSDAITWTEFTGGGAALSDDDPADLGTADPGTSPDASRSDHVHDLPTAAAVGALATGALDTDATMAANSDTKVASQKATKTALALKAPIASPTFTGTVSGIDATMVGAVPTTRTLAGLDLSVDRSAAAIKTALSLAKGDVGLGSVTNDAQVKVTDIGTTVQAQDAELSALAGLTSAANKMPYFTGSGTAGLADLTSFARTLLDDTDATTMLATLGAVSLANRPTIIRKPSNQTYLSTITLVNDTALIAPIGASETWWFRIVLFVKGSTSADVAVGVNLPSGATVLAMVHGGAASYVGTSGGSVQFQGTLTASTAAGATGLGQFGIGTTDAAAGQVVIEGTVVNSTNAGNITAQHCQAASVATLNEVMAGSFIEAKRIS